MTPVIAGLMNQTPTIMSTSLCRAIYVQVFNALHIVVRGQKSDVRSLRLDGSIVR